MRRGAKPKAYGTRGKAQGVIKKWKIEVRKSCFAGAESDRGEKQFAWQVIYQNTILPV